MRNTKEVKFQIKATGNSGEFSGRAAVFNNTDHGNDIILPGAFKRFRRTASGKIRVALYHDMERFIGLSDVEQKEDGLHVKGKLDLGLSYATDAHVLMKNGTLDGLSVGFDILEGGAEFRRDDRDNLVRVISAAELWEYSIVPFGMNPEALITDVKDARGIHNVREFELFLRAHGFSRREAKSICAKGFNNLQREASGNDPLSDSAEASNVMLEEIKQAIIEANTGS